LGLALRRPKGSPSEGHPTLPAPLTFSLTSVSEKQIALVSLAEAALFFLSNS